MSDPLTGTEVALRLVGGALGSAILLPAGFLLNDAIGRVLARVRLYTALRKEIAGGRAAVGDMQRDITETVPRADKIVDDVGTKKALSFEDLHFMFSGWVIYVPTYTLVDTVTKMRSDDVGLAIRYFDLWNQVAAYEKSYSAAHAKLVELADKIGEQPIRCHETACQMRGCLRRLVISAEELQNAAEALEKALAPEKERRVVRWLLRRFA
jgi:hypothetical protein